MIDFATLQGLTIPEGVVTQIEDASGRVLWALANDEPIVLEVAKQTLTTYASETTYTDEQFVLLDIYPEKSNSTVEVTYGGLTKTLTFSGTNAQQVFFGTFNGVSDSVTTPASGQLTIEGGCKNFAVGTYKTYNSTTSKTTTNYCGCITDVVEWGGITSIPNSAFAQCGSITEIIIPDSVQKIGGGAFFYCSTLNHLVIPKSVTTCSAGSSSTSAGGNFASTSYLDTAGIIGSGCNIEFGWDTDIPSNALHSHECTSIYIPASIRHIGAYAFHTTALVLLTSYHFLGETPPSVEDGFIYVREDAEDFKEHTNIVVPRGCGEIYKAAEGWGAYANVIVEAE